MLFLLAAPVLLLQCSNQPTTVEDGRVIVHKYKFDKSCSLLDAVVSAHDEEPPLTADDGSDVGLCIFFPLHEDGEQQSLFVAQTTAQRDA